MSRIVVYECCPGETDHVPAMLEGEAYEVVACADGERLLEAVVERPAQVVVFELRGESHADLRLLQLFRRVAPGVPLILVANNASLEIHRLVQELRPIYYAVWPVEPAELRDAVHAALERRGSRTG